MTDAQDSVCVALESQAQMDWKPVQADYEIGPVTVREICEKYGVSSKTLYRVRNQQNWLPRSVRGTRPGMILRITQLLETQLSRLERSLGGDELMDEKQMSLLTNLTRNLEKLAEMDKRERGKLEAEYSAKETEALRQKLLARIDELASR